MKIGFLIIGSEVLDGKITDLNTKILADFLRHQHLEINEAFTIRDHKDAIEKSLQSLFENNDLIITSGGLGPTKDDLTKECVGHYLGRKLILSPEAIEVSKENYQRFGKIFPGQDHGYAYLPEGFYPLSNATGFAPGFYTKHQDKFLFSAPGVPREFKSMLTDHLMKIIAEKTDNRVLLKHIIVRTKNVPEEKIFQEVDTSLWEKLEKFGEVSSLPILMGVDIGVKINAKTQEELARKETEIDSIFKSSPLSKNVWNYGPESIEEKIVALSNQKKIKFGFAESATGGLCSHRMTSTSGSGKSFMGSIVSYDEIIKINLLGVKEKTIEEFSDVSPQTAQEMAEGLLNKFNLDIAISITGWAGPTGGSDKFPIGSVCIGRAIKNQKTTSEIFHLTGDRETLKLRFSQVALYALLYEVEHFAQE